jgi:hypothetical protein
LDLIKYDKQNDLREIVFEKITNEDTLANIINNDIYDDDVRFLAINKVNKQDILINIAKNNENEPAIRKIAIKRINNEDILLDMIKNDKSKIIRKAAIEKIKQNKSRKAFSHS